MYINRRLSIKLKEHITKFPVISLNGPRQSGKTTLLRNTFSDFEYINLERMDIREMISSDPIGFLRSKKTGVILDEVQNMPDLFSYIQHIVDERRTVGQFILSGSQNFLLNQQISQTLAGRVYIGYLLPFDFKEIDLKKLKTSEIILNGFYPRLFQMQIEASDFYPSYLQTYVERDVRSLNKIENLSTFSRFLTLCAGRIGQVLNISSLANDTGVSVNTAKNWLSILEAGFIIYLLQPFYKNFSKRQIKSPKLYFYDTGVAASLLKINNSEVLYSHYSYGSLFENLIISDIIKNQYHKGNQTSVYYWRESNGIEIDCIIENNSNEITALEIKAGETFTKDYLKNLKKIDDSNLIINKKLIYNGKNTFKSKEIEILNWRDYLI